LHFVVNALICSVTKEYDTVGRCRHYVGSNSLRFPLLHYSRLFIAVVFQRPLTSSITLFPRAPLLRLLPGRRRCFFFFFFFFFYPRLFLFFAALRLRLALFSSTFLSTVFPLLSPPRPSRESVVRGHLVAWLLGYSVIDHGGTAEKKKNRKNTSDRSRHLYSR